ncbi:hypothetical protein IV203_027076 [Nitzschia inconspicua]|uniref:Uncharacterized protein n=1 Tax=Nitzschia inconspicua TaxID=303405 RepID=A0A9K3PY85_9STRA|nr:hypothetical protein IV203_027076 [Nitzschia inconspicua]
MMMKQIPQTTAAFLFSFWILLLTVNTTFASNQQQEERELAGLDRFLSTVDGEDFSSTTIVDDMPLVQYSSNMSGEKGRDEVKRGRDDVIGDNRKLSLRKRGTKAPTPALANQCIKSIDCIARFESGCGRCMNGVCEEVPCNGACCRYNIMVDNGNVSCPPGNPTCVGNFLCIQQNGVCTATADNVCIPTAENYEICLERLIGPSRTPASLLAPTTIALTPVPTLVPTTVAPTPIPTLVPMTVAPTPIPTLVPTTVAPTPIPTLVPTSTVVALTPAPIPVPPLIECVYDIDCAGRIDTGSGCGVCENWTCTAAKDCTRPCCSYSLDNGDGRCVDQGPLTNICFLFRVCTPVVGKWCEPERNNVCDIGDLDCIARG